VRGIRLNLMGTSIFRVQARAILRAAPYANLGIMFPMVSSVEELRAAKEIVEEEKRALAVTAPVQIGVMVEVPSAALMADILAPEVDFFSIGTNDLTQYTLAMDRGHPRLAKMADALHPAVLRLIGRACSAARGNGKWVGVCGGAAGDPLAAMVLIGLGVDELSVSPKSIPAIKAAIRRLSLERSREVAKKALGLSTASEVRALLSSEMEALENSGGAPGREA
jgi:phosphoenolpyruvate-protein kinase (PTS system EI component)